MTGTLVGYFSDACGHCVALQPAWKALAKAVADQKLPFAVEAKQCYGDHWSKGSDYKECAEKGIQSFPTLKYYSDSGDLGNSNSGLVVPVPRGSPEYQAKSMLSWLKSHATDVGAHGAVYTQGISAHQVQAILQSGNPTINQSALSVDTFL